MSEQFSPQSFADALAKKCPSPNPCPFCGNVGYKIYTKVSQLQVQDNTDGITFGKSIPCGVVVCENCGNINLFALGILGFEI